MTTANVSLQGQNNGAGDAEALFYKVFTGEVLSAYMAKNIMEGRHRVRNIQNQKSASFANTGQAGGRIHQPGTEILGQDMKHSETVITVDDLLISDVFIADIYEAMNHYEVRRDYSTQLGAAMGRTFDKQTLRVGVQAARSSNKISGLPGGTTLTLGASFTNAEFAEACFAAHQQFVENDVDPDDAFVLVRPDRYFSLVQEKDLLNRDWGGAGSYSEASIPRIGGLPIFMTNHLPQQNDLLAANQEDGTVNTDLTAKDGLDIISGAYADDYSNLQALIMTPRAIGTVKLIDLSLQSEWDIRRQGTLMLSRMAVGHGVLRPEDAIELVT